MPTPKFIGGNEFIFYNNILPSKSKKSIKLVKLAKQKNSNIIGSNNIQDIKININYNSNSLFIMMQMFLLINMFLIITLIILIIQSMMLNKDYLIILQ
jgi:hypothetical protein